MFLVGEFRDAKKLLPKILHPLWRHLKSIRKKLVKAYIAFEKSFDGSEIKDVYMWLKPRLEKAVANAKGLKTEPNALSRKLEGEEMEFEMDTPGEEPGQQVSGPEEERNGTQPATGDDDHFTSSSSDSRLGKRKRDTPEVRRVPKKARVNDEQT